MTHISVLKKEVLEYLDPKPNQNFIDCTIGSGGHALAILEKIAPEGKVLGIDWDPENIKSIGFSERLLLVNDSYANLKDIVGKNNFGPINGILLDAGMSSYHVDKSNRGFTFLKNELLDMRYNTNKEAITASEIINKWPEEEIEKILREYGEERFSGKIARIIIEERKKQVIGTTFQLVEIIKKAIPTRFQYGHIHFATRTFQGLRIAVNQELDNLKNVLPQIIEQLEPQGRIVIISFHSLEDRIVKNFLKEEFKKNTIKILTKKPITATLTEIQENPRARSAKLRAALKPNT